MAVMLVVLAACLLVSFIGLVSGTTVSVRATRVRPRVTEEVIETRGIVTVPVERVVDSGRVDVTLRRRVLGVVPWSTRHLADVVDVSVASGSNEIRDSRGRRTSSYSSETLILRTRDGEEWSSEPASGVVGGSPTEAAERLRALLDGDDADDVAVWWAPWLNNAVGIPFALVTALVLWSLVRVALDPDAARRLGSDWA